MKKKGVDPFLEPFLPFMPRPPRLNYADTVYHVINRSNARIPIFINEGDYLAFEKILEEAKERENMRILAYCIMPNHWHLVLYPRSDGDVSRFMGWVTSTHTQRWHSMHETVGSGHLYQGRYKSFPVQTDEYFLTLCRYVEQNPLRAKLVKHFLEWRWSSVWRRERGTQKQQELLDAWPTSRPEKYLTWLGESENEERLKNIRMCVKRGQPYGSDWWRDQIAKKLHLESTMRSRGRPSKEEKGG